VPEGGVSVWGHTRESPTIKKQKERQLDFSPFTSDFPQTCNGFLQKFCEKKSPTEELLYSETGANLV